MEASQDVKVEQLIKWLQDRDILISLYSIRQCPAFLQSLTSSKEVEQLGSHLILSSFLMFLKSNNGFCGPDNWNPYLNSLPECYSVPFFLNAQTVNILPRYLKALVEAQIVLVTKNFQLLKTKFMSSQPPLDNFSWAWFTVNTRGVFYDYKKADPKCDNLALVPFLDLFNHSCDVTVKAGFIPDTDCYEIVTETGIDAGSQAFINYGPHGNVKLFVEYGFVIADNPNDCIPITLEELQEHLGYTLVQDEKIELARRNGFHHNMSIHRDGCTWGLLACLQILTMKTGNVHQWQRLVYETDLESDCKLLQTLRLFMDTLETEITQCKSGLIGTKNGGRSEVVLLSLLDEHLRLLKQSGRALANNIEK
ncbi:SET domain-containing protein 4-like isoform X2 [Tigriopus californicus]|uniref:SET domain-containing protein 4-like isoform X2 n=1 Tax=Tigriopus californicus TaxID=6832 RepID=UPI0027D9FAFB|nr:SET domain-containing protein 4-like isoform X2 [Tigriopus californicus]